ncbi:hypothetical protein COOONC_02619 [Cooperia oncophora]
MTPAKLVTLTYDCDLEQTAKELLNHKGSNYQKHGIAVNHKEGIVNVPGRWMYELAEVVDQWTNEDAPRQRLMYPYAPYMGCAYRHWNGDDGKLHFKVVCVYKNDRSRFEALQKSPSGKPCTKKQDCGTFGGDFDCLADLCFAPAHSVIFS